MLGHSAIAESPVAAGAFQEEVVEQQPVTVRASFTAGYVIRATPPPRVISVTVSPATATGSRQFSASATVENGASTAVTWELGGGGSVSASGYFTEPAKTDQAQTIIIRARSVFDPSVFGFATITIAANVVAPPVSTVTGVLVAPGTATGSQQFSRTVLGENNPSQAGTWSTPFGSISASGYFTEPARTEAVQTFKVRFTSEQDPDMWGEATVTIPALVGGGDVDPALRRVQIQLGEAHGPAANLKFVQVSLAAGTGPHDAGPYLFQSSSENTDENGVLEFTMPEETIAAGASAVLAVLMPDGRHYLGRVVVL